MNGTDMKTFTCAMCGARMEDSPDGGFTVPPTCIELVDGGSAVDADAVHGVVAVDLCAECAEIARRMVLEYDTSPLPECDVDAVRYNERGTLSAFVDTTRGDPVERIVADAVTTVTTCADGGTERRLESKLLEARTIVLSMEDLDAAETGGQRGPG